MKDYRIMFNIDSLEITYELNDNIKTFFNSIDKSKQFYDIEIIRTNKFENYKYTFDILVPEYENNNIIMKKYATIYFGSYCKFRQHLYLKIENEQLYKGNLIILDYIEEIFELNVINDSYIELAVDVDYDIVSKFYRLLKNKNYTLKILRNLYNDMNEEITDILHISKGTRNNPYKFKSFYIENKEKGLKLVCYDKSKEILDNNNEKHYIKELYGFDNIYRLEIRVHHKMLKDTLNTMKISDLYLHNNLLNKDFLFDIYINLMNRLIKIIYKNNEYNLLSILLG